MVVYYYCTGPCRVAAPLLPPNNSVLSLHLSMSDYSHSCDGVCLLTSPACVGLPPPPPHFFPSAICSHCIACVRQSPLYLSHVYMLWHALTALVHVGLSLTYHSSDCAHSLHYSISGFRPPLILSSACSLSHQSIREYRHTTVALSCLCSLFSCLCRASAPLLTLFSVCAPSTHYSVSTCRLHDWFISGCRPPFSP
jgi:hypothetical protein